MYRRPPQRLGQEQTPTAPRSISGAIARSLPRIRAVRFVSAFPMSGSRALTSMSEQKRSRRWIVPRDGSFTRHPTKTALDYGLMRLIPRYHLSRRRCVDNRRRLRFRCDRRRRSIRGPVLPYFATPRSDRRIVRRRKNASDRPLTSCGKRLKCFSR